MEGKWIQPSGGFNVGLKILNSITGKDEEFIPKDGRNVGWYICGPTVYDSSHLGHARNYVIFDVLRRILSDYFGYNVFYVMNITDIDDKIIIRSHFRHLSKVVETIKVIIGGNEQCKERLEKNAQFFDNFTHAQQLVKNDNKEIALLQRVHSELSQMAKKEFAEVAAPNELAVFEEFSIQEAYLQLAKIFEQEFLEDMDKLGVRRVDALTRVSEYVPEIIEYIEKIIKNGYAYEAAGNVYFDIAKFKAAGFAYAKTSHILDDNDSHLELLAEGDGALASSEGKRNSSDFALWKRSKPGEPHWESPWGLGRPGWHIECSAMCSDLLGSNVDINCGGVDLKFPHHDNQLAQSEAHFGCKQWVNYFLHSGHLHIAKLKMAKSLKNFITIRECLRNYHARHIRFYFLLHRFSASLDIDMVGGGPPDLGGKTGTLFITSAKLAHVNLTPQLVSLVVNNNSIHIAKGTNLVQQFGIEGLAQSSKLLLEVEYLMDGLKKLSGWQVNAQTGELEEELFLKAGGKIMQFEEAITIEKIFIDFFLNIQVLMRTLPAVSDVGQKWNSADRRLFDALQTAKKRVHEALCDSFDTPTAIGALVALVGEANGYIKEFSSALKRSILLEIVDYITKIFKVFGLIYDEEFGYEWSENKREKVEEVLSSLLNLFTSFRDTIRSYSINKKSREFILDFCENTKIPPAAQHPTQAIFDLFQHFIHLVRENAGDHKKLLVLCDELRDDLILQLGVRFEDDHFVKGQSVWKLDEIEFTLADRKKKREEFISRLHILAEKEAKKKAEDEKKRLAEEISRIPPELFFRSAPEHLGKFSAFDAQGIPTHDSDGKEVSKGLRKKLETLLQKHVTKHKQQLQKDAQSNNNNNNNNNNN